MDSAQSTNATSSNEKNNIDGPSSNPSTSDGLGGNTPESNFDCNICLDTAKDAVVSICGHLFWLVFFFDQI